MPRAAKWFEPDLTNNGVLEKAAKHYSWSAADKKEAHEWYKHFLEAAWNANGAPIDVLNRKADDLWHYHIMVTKDYSDYCDSCLGGYLHHTPVDSQPAATPAQQAAVQTFYDKNWPVPDSIVSCHS